MMESIDRLKKYVEANTDRTVLLTKYPEQYDVRCSTVINDLIDAIEREVEEGYVELPKDADGKHIHVGDMLVGKYLGGKPVVECARLTLRNDWIVGYGWQNGAANVFTHYKTPTVEDVLREFFEEYDSVSGYAPDENKVLADFAKRLQLKEAE